MTDKLTYSDCAPLLRERGYAPAVFRAGSVPGPHAIMQLDFSTIAKPGDECALLGALGPARGPAPHVVADPSSTYLVRVCVSASGPAAADVLAAVEGLGKNALVHSVGGNHVYVFRTSAWGIDLTARASYDNDSVRIDQRPVALGAPDDWRDGVTPLDRNRAELPELSADGARALIAAAKGAFSKHAPAFVPYQPPPRVVPASVALERGNDSAIVDVLAENGYAALLFPWMGDEGTRRNPRDPAVGVHLRAPRYRNPLRTIESLESRDSWLCSVTIQAGPKIDSELLHELVARYIGDAKRVERINADGSRTFLFQHDCERGSPFTTMTMSRSKRDGVMDVHGTWTRVTVESEGIVEVLGPAGAWRDETPLTVRRDELPVLDRNRAESLLAAFERFMSEPYAAPGIVERVKKVVRR